MNVKGATCTIWQTVKLDPQNRGQEVAVPALTVRKPETQSLLNAHAAEQSVTLPVHSGHAGTDEVRASVRVYAFTRRSERVAAFSLPAVRGQMTLL